MAICVFPSSYLQDFNAAFDQPSSLLVLNATQPTRLQYLSLQCADKLNYLADANERLLDTRFGSSGADRGEGGGSRRLVICVTGGKGRNGTVRREA